MSQYKLGAKLHDPGKTRFEAIKMESVGVELPDVVDYSYMYVIDNQGQLGTCVSYGTRKAIDVYYTKRHNESRSSFVSSARAIYSTAKSQFEAGDTQDDGLAVSDGLSVAKEFYVLESDWPSTMTAGEQDFPQWLLPVPENIKKTDFVFKDVVRLEDITVEQMELALYTHGPLVIGINWLEEWMDAGPDGRLLSDGTSAGGHCINITSYKKSFQNLDGTLGAFKIANNWGTDWGKNGFCYLPYSSTSMPTDVYTIRA